MTNRITDPRILAGMTKQVALHRALIAKGGERLGWKAGFGAPAALAKFGLEAPVVGFLMRDGLIENGGQVSLAGWSMPVAEPEIAVHLGAAIAPGASEATIRAAIIGIGAAIELVDVTFPPEDVEQVLSVDIYQRHVVLGPCDETRAGGMLYGIMARFLRGGVEFASTTTLEKNTGRITDVVRQVADVAGQFYGGVRAGDVIIAGSLTAPIALQADEVSFAHALDPVGTAAVRFQR